MKNYDTGGIIGNDPLSASQSNGLFSGGLLGKGDDIISFGLFGDADASSNLFKELSGYSAQQREFEQQEYLLDKEQSFADERNRMERLKEAGVNPLTAAAGVAGSAASPIAPAVSNATGGPSAAFGSAASLMSSANQMSLAGSQNEKNRADAALSWSEERNKDNFYAAQIMGIAGKFAKDMTDAGTPEVDATSIAFSAISKGLGGIGALLKADGVVRRIDKEMRAYDDRHKIDNKQLDIMQRDLDLKQQWLDKGEFEKQSLEIQVARDELAKKREEFLTEQWRRFNGDPALEENARLWDLAQQYGFDSPQYKSAMRIAYDSHYYTELGGFTANIDTAYDRAFNEWLGQNAANAEYAPYMANIEATKAAILEMIKAVYENPSDPMAIIGKVMNMFAALPYSLKLDNNRVSQANKPTTSPRKKPHPAF